MGFDPFAEEAVRARAGAPPALGPLWRSDAPRLSEAGPGFDREVGGDGGYVWWYVDATSDDGEHGLTMIAFIGSVFSPYYAWSGWRDPMQHCAINVALYRLKGGLAPWTMTERGARHVSRDARHFRVGRNALHWDGEFLEIEVDDVAAPAPTRVRGTIRVRPQVETGIATLLEAEGRHVWRPFAPKARVELVFRNPALNWSGDGYFDSNSGDEPLERAFRTWRWARAHGEDGLSVYYEADRRRAAPFRLAIDIAADGSGAESRPPPDAPLPRPLWGVTRTGWNDAGAAVTGLKTLEDAPFYTRQTYEGVLKGKPARFVHESLDLDRLKHPVLRALLPFRMPRVFW